MKSYIPILIAAVAIVVLIVSSQQPQAAPIAPQPSPPVINSIGGSSLPTDYQASSSSSASAPSEEELKAAERLHAWHRFATVPGSPTPYQPSQGMQLFDDVLAIATKITPPPPRPSRSVALPASSNNFAACSNGSCSPRGRFGRRR